MPENKHIEYKQQVTPELEKKVVAFLNSNEDGSGIPRILQVYDKDVFKFSDNFLRVVLLKTQDEIGNEFSGQAGGQAGGQVSGQVKGLTKRQNQVLQLIISNPNISRRELSEDLNINESAIQKHINSLKAKNIIEREGKTTGYWIVLTENE